MEMLDIFTTLVCTRTGNSWRGGCRCPPHSQLIFLLQLNLVEQATPEESSRKNQENR